jgi:hypothetical protein
LTNARFDTHFLERGVQLGTTKNNKGEKARGEDSPDQPYHPCTSPPPAAPLRNPSTKVAISPTLQSWWISPPSAMTRSRGSDLHACSRRRERRAKLAAKASRSLVVGGEGESGVSGAGGAEAGLAGIEEAALGIVDRRSLRVDCDPISIRQSTKDGK